MAIATNMQRFRLIPFHGFSTSLKDLTGRIRLYFSMEWKKLYVHSLSTLLETTVHLHIHGIFSRSADIKFQNGQKKCDYARKHSLSISSTADHLGFSRTTDIKTFRAQSSPKRDGWRLENDQRDVYPTFNCPQTVAPDSCSWPTEVEPDVVFHRCSPSISSFGVLCILRCFSAHRGHKEFFFLVSIDFPSAQTTLTSLINQMFLRCSCRTDFLFIYLFYVFRFILCKL